MRNLDADNTEREEIESEFIGTVMTFWFGFINLYRVWTKRKEEDKDGGLQVSVGGIQVDGTKHPCHMVLSTDLVFWTI